MNDAQNRQIKYTWRIFFGQRWREKLSWLHLGYFMKRGHSSSYFGEIANCGVLENQLSSLVLLSNMFRAGTTERDS